MSAFQRNRRLFYSVLINVKLTLIEKWQQLPGHKHRFGFIAIVFKVLAITIFGEIEPASLTSRFNPKVDAYSKGV